MDMATELEFGIVNSQWNSFEVNRGETIIIPLKILNDAKINA